MVVPLEGRDVVLTYPNGVRALDGVSITLAEGELCAVIGPNGSGKTSLLRALAGLAAVTGGEVRSFGVSLGELAPRARARWIAYMQQDVTVPAAVPVRELVLLSRYAYLGPFERPRPRDRAIVERALAEVDAADIAGRTAREMSGGELQRVLLARVLAQETPCLLLDEPTASLDPRHQLAFLACVRRLADTAGRSILLVTHDLNLAAQFADRVVLLRGGSVAAAGAPAAVLRSDVLAPIYGQDLVFGRLRSAPVGEERPWVLPWLRGQQLSTLVTEAENGE